jgi:hypothetical protein
VSAPATPEEFIADELDDRRIRGYALANAIANGTVNVTVENENSVIYWSIKDKTRAYRVTREWKNDRGTMRWEYRCACNDFKKNGRTDCEHIFSERIGNKEAIVVGEIPGHEQYALVGRLPPRRRYAADGRAFKTAQRAARVKMPTRIPELVVSLQKAYDRDQDAHLDEHPEEAEKLRDGQASASTRAATLLHKVVNGASADEMVSTYERLIDDKMLPLTRPPHQNTVSVWMNDAALTPVLMDMLAISNLPYRRREYAAMVDESKLSQMRTAHARKVDYEGDIRDEANWMNCHALVGVETTIVMAVTFSLNHGKGTHEIKYLKELMLKALPTFRIRYLLGDKAYLSEDIIGWLWERSIRAFIPVKKRWDVRTKKFHYEACADLIERYDKHQRIFHAVYRFRVKIESLFSHLKDVAGGFIWSRGRWNKSAKDATTPCTAWINEALCKFIYVNLRTTVTTEETTGFQIDYLVRNCFFPPVDEPVIVESAA